MIKEMPLIGDNIKNAEVGCLMRNTDMMVNTHTHPHTHPAKKALQRQTEGGRAETEREASALG